MHGDEYRWRRIASPASRDLASKCAQHASIDTYAKKLFITNKSEAYISLKAVLTCFFIYEQTVNPPDKRYDSFFASILGSRALDFKGDIRILSWNYDFQFEKAYSEYSLEKGLRKNQELLRIYPDIFNWDEIENGFSIFKINGTTGFEDLKDGAHRSLISTFDELSGFELVEKLVWYYLALTKCERRVISKLSFAWDRDPSDKLIEAACAQVNGSQALVVIGYSFPFFNREVDRKILLALWNRFDAKIYVQDINPKAIVARIESAFPPGRNFEIIPIDQVEQFHLPAEL